jgi:hypothetical protein
VGQGAFRNYGLKFDLSEAGALETIQHDWRGVKLKGTDKPWLFTSGLKGVTQFRVPLIERGDKGRYTVRLGFTPLAGDKPGSRVFAVRLQGKKVLPKFDVVKAADGQGKVVVREFKGVEIDGEPAAAAKKALDETIAKQQKPAETKLAAAKKATTNAIANKAAAEKVLAAAKTAVSNVKKALEAAEKTAKEAEVKAAKEQLARELAKVKAAQSDVTGAASKLTQARIAQKKAEAALATANANVAKARTASAAADRVGLNLAVELVAPGFEGSAVIDVHPKLHHLGDNVVAGWTESTPKPEGFVLMIPFEFKGGDEAQTLSIAQQDVNNDWLIILNGREIGRLRKDAAKLTVRVPVPKGVLKEVANELVIRPPGKSNDDIQVGRVQLFAGHPASTVIQSLEIIREDKKTASKR